MRTFVGAFDCIDKAKICPAAAICTTKTTIYPRIQRLGSRASNKEKKRMKKRNYLTTSHFGGQFRIYGISLDFSYLYKKTAFIVRKGDNCRLFCVICHRMHQIRVHKPH